MRDPEIGALVGRLVDGPLGVSPDAGLSDLKSEWPGLLVTRDV